MLTVIQEDVWLTCMCILAMYLSMWCLDVYCRLCSVVVVRFRKVGWVRLPVVL